MKGASPKKAAKKPKGFNPKAKSNVKPLSTVGETQETAVVEMVGKKKSKEDKK